MASDGKVVISTALDNSGFEKGIKAISGQLGGLGNTLKNIAGMLAVAFSAKKITEFAAESSQAAMQLSDALTGLKSILDGQGRSFSEAEAFIEEYTQDGLIPAANAITAYKNLASRGYDDSQIKQVMTALKDASAYGRQSSMTMGEAVESATEGLKNENSILVDNAGVTKNVAKMWDEYAASIGTTANNLTQEQKIQAEVNGILEESKYQAGDAATVAGTLSGQLQQLSFRLNDLKVAVGNAINPIIQTFLPIINSAITTVTEFANAVASVVGALFGKASVQTSALADSNDSVASSASAGVEAEEELADATEAAGKAAKKSLASFDELNVLQSGAESSSSSGATNSGTSASTSIAVEAEVDDELSPKLQAVVDIVKEVIGTFEQLADLITGKISFKEFIDELTPLQSVLLDIATALTAIAVATAALKAANGLSTLIKSVKALEATSLVGKIAEVFAIVATGAGTLSEAITFVFGTVAKTAAGIGSLVGGAVLAVTNFFSMLSNGFSWLNEALMVIGVALAAVGAIILGAPAAVTGVVAAIVAAVATAIVVIKEHWNEICVFFSELCASIGVFFSELWAGIQSIWVTVSNWFNTNVIQPVAIFFQELWENISTAASNCWTGIVGFFTPAIEWFSQLFGSVYQTLSDIFYNIGVIATGCWEIIKAVWAIVSAWFNTNIIQPVSTFFSNMWTEIKTWAVNAWEGIKSVFSTIASWIGMNIIQPVGNFFSGLWSGFREKAKSAWEGVKTVFGNVASFFKDTFQKAWQGIVGVFSVAGDIFTDIKDGILTAFKAVVNGIIRGLNSVISIPFKGINTALQNIKDINILGLTPFSGLETISVPQIPYLAKGAVLPANKPFLAMVGDQRHGTNIEAPLETIQEAVAIVMADLTGCMTAGFEATVAILREILQAVYGIEIGDDVIGQAVARYNSKMAIIKGGNA